VKRFSVITGFLGSGKTTLLNRLLRDPDMASTAVLINELGTVGVDHLIVDQFDDDIVLLESGCICCDIRDDLSLSLLDLYGRCERGEIPPFDQALLETTGIADPAAILQLLMADELIVARYEFGTVATVVDACFGLDNLRTVDEALRQVQFADRLIVSKADLVDEPKLALVRQALEELNPTADIIDSREATPGRLFAGDVLHKPFAGPRNPGHSEHFNTFQVRWDKAVDWADIEIWIEGLLSARGEDIWRVKGLMQVSDSPRPLVFQSVQHSVYAPTHLAEWPDDTRQTDLTFITRGFSREAALASLRPFVELNACDR